MNPFKVGDRVKCVRSGNSKLKKGKIYIVNDARFSNDIGLEGQDVYWIHQRFAKVESILDEELFTL